jgi:hypothetical protein
MKIKLAKRKYCAIQNDYYAYNSFRYTEYIDDCQFFSSENPDPYRWCKLFLKALKIKSTDDYPWNGAYSIKEKHIICCEKCIKSQKLSNKTLNRT